MIKNLLLVGLGGSLGSMIRYLFFYYMRSPVFPFATLLVNVLGSFIIGLVIGLGIKDDTITDNWKLFLATGVCGGFTTFSALSIENLEMMREGKFMLSLIYITSSMLAGITAAWIGFKLTNN